MNINSYLKKQFRDLFERLGYVDDGWFDWQILKKSQQEAKAKGTQSCVCISCIYVCMYLYINDFFF